MRKSFEIHPSTNISRARAYLALPGVGDVWINGQKVDGRAGTRSVSQYDIRALYHTYDVQRHLRVGTNVVAVYVGLGWFGHPPLGEAYGPPTLRALIRIQTYDASGTTMQTMSVGTDTTWLETGGPVIYDDIYNGSTYDARLETPGMRTTLSTLLRVASPSYPCCRWGCQQSIGRPRVIKQHYHEIVLNT